MNSGECSPGWRVHPTQVTRGPGFPAVDVWRPLLLHLSQNLKSFCPQRRMRERRKRWRLRGPLCGAREAEHAAEMALCLLQPPRAREPRGPDFPRSCHPLLTKGRKSRGSLSRSVSLPPPPFEDGLEKVVEKQGASYLPTHRQGPSARGSGLCACPGPDAATASPSLPCSFPELPTCLWSELKPYRLSVLPPWPQE